MDTPRSPGVAPLTWATLRLLTFSWLVLGVLTVLTLRESAGHPLKR